MKLTNIEFLIDGNGTATIGRLGPVHCAAVAADEVNNWLRLFEHQEKR